MTNIWTPRRKLKVFRATTKKVVNFFEKVNPRSFCAPSNAKSWLRAWYVLNAIVLYIAYLSLWLFFCFLLHTRRINVRMHFVVEIYITGWTLKVIMTYLVLLFIIFCGEWMSQWSLTSHWIHGRHYESFGQFALLLTTKHSNQEDEKTLKIRAADFND